MAKIGYATHKKGTHLSGRESDILSPRGPVSLARGTGLHGGLAFPWRDKEWHRQNQGVRDSWDTSAVNEKLR